MSTIYSQQRREHPMDRLIRFLVSLNVAIGFVAVATNLVQAVRHSHHWWFHLIAAGTLACLTALFAGLRHRFKEEIGA